MAAVKKAGNFSLSDGRATIGKTDARQILVILLGRDRRISPELIEASNTRPIELQNEIISSISQLPYSLFWIFKGIIYEVDARGGYSIDQMRLLIFDEFEKEKGHFERLKNRYETGEKEETYTRIPIPEAVRIEVWRRDGGKCVKCSSRVNLEYDHIIPISQGGSNTARNIELLCETCNRRKGARIG